MFDLKLVFWPAYALIFAIPTLIFIPRHEYKRYFIYGFIFGGMIDVITIVVLGNIMGEFKYLAGPLMVKGIPLFVPLTFVFVWMLFFYFLPVRIGFLVPYIIGFSGFSILIGFILQNFGLFQYTHGFIRATFITGITFLFWFTVSAWVYLHYAPKPIKDNI